MGLEGASRPRVATTLEGLPRHTTTHMQASTVRLELLTGDICQAVFPQCLASPSSFLPHWVIAMHWVGEWASSQ